MHLLPMINAFKLDQPIQDIVPKMKNKQKKKKEKEEGSDQESMEVYIEKVSLHKFRKYKNMTQNWERI